MKNLEKQYNEMQGRMKKILSMRERRSKFELKKSLMNN